MKKISLVLFFLSSFLLSPVQAEAARLNAYFFWGDGCPHCAKEKDTISYLENKYSGVDFHDFEVYKSPENQALFREAALALRTSANGVPFTVIGDTPFVGFSESQTPRMLEERIKECLISACPDTLASITGIAPAESEAEDTIANPTPASSGFSVPVLGDIEAQSVSLPLLSMVLGVLDGFNPCALWVLLFLISLLLGMENRRRMWILGSTFIIASAAVYFLFMAAWLNLILFIGFIVWVRIGIGILALAGAYYSLKKFFTSKDGTCEIATGGEKRVAVFEKLKELVKKESLWFALAGIAALAVAVNFVELVCSAGLPAIFTQVLALNSLPTWQYYGYIALYIFFFMIDDLFVFFAAMLTMRMVGITTKYSRYSRLIGGILMAIIGLLLILKPEWLMFG